MSEELEQVTPTYSQYIDEIAEWLDRNGVRVNLLAFDLPGNVGGLYRTETKQIFMNVLNAKDALMTLAHEAGHWLGHMIQDRSDEAGCERQAYVYGRYVLQWFDAPVTREEWRADCRKSEFWRKKDLAPSTEALYR